MKVLIDESTKKKAVCESSLLINNPLAPNDIPEALKYLASHSDYSSYHLLLAIRQYYPESYKAIANRDKAAILCSALRNSTYLNDWGYLDNIESFDGESAKALLDSGEVALSFLVPLLEDNDSAPLFGSEEATLSREYKYRRKDFAYRYISLLLGQSPTFSPDLKERNKSIESLKSKLKTGTK